MKKIWNIIKNLFVWFIVLFAICFAIFTIISLRTVDAANREILGYKVMIVRSDSMSATDFSAGDLVLVKDVDVHDLKVGDIISFRSQNSHNYGEVVTHKIRDIIYNKSNEPVFITYGTTTGATDESPVSAKYVIGKYHSRIPKLGLFFNFLKTPKGYFTLILIPMVVIMAAAFWNIYRNMAGMSKQAVKQQEEQSWQEKKAYLSEMDDIRRENEEMRREVQELKVLVAKLTGEELPPEDEKIRKDPREDYIRSLIEESKKDELDLDSIMAEFSRKKPL